MFEKKTIRCAREERKKLCNLKHEETDEWVEGRMNYDLSMY